MKLLRDSFRWRVLRQQLFAARRDRRVYVVTVPAPRAAAVRSSERTSAPAPALHG
ncbi:hypothetical protein ACO2Q2_08585 [Dyella sp. KRB-257]|uniref:hypothetical protein n=1 Tax=Dyella sp. KRB-257 TaxID=3400915 RepID=UPI003BFF7A54